MLRAAAGLFAKHGVAGTTMRDIGSATDLLAGSLYHHFASKNAIVLEVLERFMEDIDGRVKAVVAVPRAPVDTLAALVSELLAIVAEHPAETAMYQDDRKYLRDHGLLAAVDTVADTVHTTFLEVIGAAVAAGELRSDVEPELIYRPIRETVWASLGWPLRDRYGPDNLARDLVSLFLDGARGPVQSRRGPVKAGPRRRSSA